MIPLLVFEIEGGCTERDRGEEGQGWENSMRFDTSGLYFIFGK